MRPDKANGIQGMVRIKLLFLEIRKTKWKLDCCFTSIRPLIPLRYHGYKSILFLLRSQDGFMNNKAEEEIHYMPYTISLRKRNPCLSYKSTSIKNKNDLKTKT